MSLSPAFVDTNEEEKKHILVYRVSSQLKIYQAGTLAEMSELLNILYCTGQGRHTYIIKYFDLENLDFPLNVDMKRLSHA